MKYLLDTNVLSEPVKAAADRTVLQRLAQYAHEITTAAPVFHELQYGTLRLGESAKRQMLLSYLSDVILPNIPILPYNQQAAAWHAEQRARLTRIGRPPAFVDGQIAAIAKVHGLILVTRNIDDFKDFEKLKLENWHAKA